MNKRKAQKIRRKALFIIIMTVILVICISTTLGSGFVNAESDSSVGCVQRKYYKSIEIQSGDTLWAIAAEYKGNHYDSTYAYIDEVMEMNHLDSDQIHAGQYLTIPYYDSL